MSRSVQKSVLDVIIDQCDSDTSLPELIEIKQEIKQEP